MLDGAFASKRHALDLFTFVDGSEEDRRALQRLGSIPWWASDDLRLSFLRPLPSALISLDRVLFGQTLWAYHVHHLLWWTLLVVAIAMLYGRLLPLPIAASACLLFALDEGSHYPVLWLANRGGLISLALCALSLYLHLRWRRDGVRSAAWGSPACLAVSLLAGEWAFAMIGYFVAYELLGAQDAPRARLWALAGPAVPACLFLVARSLLGYGARGSGIYADPADIPRFVGVLWERMPLLMGDLVWGIPAHWWDLGSPWRDRWLASGWFDPEQWRALPNWRTWQWTLGVSGAVAWAGAMVWTARGCNTDERRLIRWLSLGLVLALVPVCASFPSTRLTLVAGLAFAPSAVWFLRRLWQGTFGANRSWAGRAASALGICFVIATQLVAPARTNFAAAADHFLGVAAWVGRAEVPRDTSQMRLILLTSTEFTSTFFLAYVRHQQGLGTPRSFYPVSAARYAHTLERLSSRALRLSVIGGSLLESDAERLFRGDENPLRVGDVIALPGMRVEITRLRDGLPQQVVLHFDRDLDDPELAFLTATPRGIERVNLPAAGDTIVLKRAASPHAQSL